MDVIAFQYFGRVGHFLKAEAGVSAPSYPVPPRTVILGLLGAILGLEKDTPQEHLGPACIAISGRLPQTFWHRVKLRKENIPFLPSRIKKSQKLSEKEGGEIRPALILQEWLFNPLFNIWVSLPEPFHKDLKERLQNQQWHFQPCLGLSEMSAGLQWVDADEAKPLPHGHYPIDTIFPQNAGQMDMDAITGELAVHAIRMPRQVTSDRVFLHEDYFMEKEARPVPLTTGKAFEWKDRVIVWM